MEMAKRCEANEGLPPEVVTLDVPRQGSDTSHSFTPEIPYPSAGRRGEPTEGGRARLEGVWVEPGQKGLHLGAGHGTGHHLADDAPGVDPEGGGQAPYPELGGEGLVRIHPHQAPQGGPVQGAAD